MTRDMALARAQEVRTYRAQLKRRVKSGEVSRDEVLGMIEEPPPELTRMKVADLLAAMPRFGDTKTLRLLRRADISPLKTVGSITPQARDRLRHCLDCWPDPPPGIHR